MSEHHWQPARSTAGLIVLTLHIPGGLFKILCGNFAFNPQKSNTTYPKCNWKTARLALRWSSSSELEKSTGWPNSNYQIAKNHSFLTFTPSIAHTTLKTLFLAGFCTLSSQFQLQIFWSLLSAWDLVCYPFLKLNSTLLLKRAAAGTYMDCSCRDCDCNYPDLQLRQQSLQSIDMLVLLHWGPEEW